MDLLEAVKGRRSIRFYQDIKPPENLIKEILEIATWAPSACNRQAWRFIIIQDKTQKKKLIQNSSAFFIKDAPVLILVLYDNRTDNEEYKDYIQSASALIQNIHLIAYSKGLGSCWVNNLPLKKTIRQIFKIPDFYEPIALVTLGYPEKNKIPEPQKRLKKIDELISCDSFSFNEKNTTKQKIRLSTRKVLRRFYFTSPKFIKKLSQPLARKFEKRFD